MFSAIIGHSHVGIEFWSPPFDFNKWDFHYERRRTLFDTHACWVGPFHILICDTRRRVQSAPESPLATNSLSIEATRNA